MKSLPNDVTQLKKNIIDLLVVIKNKDLAYIELEEKYKLLIHDRYGKSSEKQAGDNSQPELFNEAEFEYRELQEEPDKKSEKKTHVGSKKSKKAGRKPIPKDLPTEQVMHDVSDEEKICKCCNKERPRVSQEVYRELKIIPAKVMVVEHTYPIYAPCTCADFLESGQKEMVQARAIKRLIPGSIAGPSLLAQVITSKYVDGLPLYRQEKIFKRLGVDISRATMSNWIMRIADKCGEALELLWEEAMKSPLMQMDETSVQVLKEKGRAPSTKSYMWVNIGYPDNKPIILFHYHPGRSGRIPLKVLEGYAGHLQTDGYAGYNAVAARPEITHVGCFAHARRKFHNAAKASKKQASAQVGLSHISKIYILEEKLRKEKLPGDDFVRKRREQVLPVLEKFHKWLKTKETQVPPSSLIGKAVGYTLKEWNKLIRYPDAWYLTPDNNRAENAIRPFVVGRKNWLFCDNPRGARASALLYSFAETAKANGLDPFSFFIYFLTHLPMATTREDVRALLPHRLTPEKISSID